MLSSRLKYSVQLITYQLSIIHSMSCELSHPVRTILTPFSIQESTSSDDLPNSGVWLIIFPIDIHAHQSNNPIESI